MPVTTNPQPIDSVNLPVSGFNSSPSTGFGPFLFGSNLYMVVNPGLRMYRSTNNGSSWSEVDPGNRPTAGGSNALLMSLVSVFKSATQIIVAYPSVGYTLSFVRFTVATDTWGAASDSGIALYTPYPAARLSIVEDAGTGDLLFLYTTSGTDAKYVVYSGGWGAPITISATESPRMLLQSSGLTFVIYTNTPLQSHSGRAFTYPASPMSVPETALGGAYAFASSNARLNAYQEVNLFGTLTLLISSAPAANFSGSVLEQSWPNVLQNYAKFVEANGNLYLFWIEKSSTQNKILMRWRPLSQVGSWANAITFYDPALYPASSPQAVTSPADIVTFSVEYSSATNTFVAAVQMDYKANNTETETVYFLNEYASTPTPPNPPNPPTPPDPPPGSPPPIVPPPEPPPPAPGTNPVAALLGAKNQCADVISKLAGEIFILHMDFSPWLAPGDAISQTIWSASTGLTVDGSTHSRTVASAQISGGEPIMEYTVRVAATTEKGLIEIQTVRVKVQEC